MNQVIEIYDYKRVPLSEMERVNRKGIYPYCGANGILDYIDDYIYDGEYILLAEDGGSYNKYEESSYIMTGKFWVNNHAHILQALKTKTRNKFIMYLLNYMDLRSYIVGSTRVKLNQEDLKKIRINLPSLPEQQKITEILSTIDEVIEKINQTIEKTEQLKQSLMQDLLTKGIGHKEFKKTEIGRIPKEWEVVKLSDIVLDFIGGGTPSTINKNYWKGKIPWMTSAYIINKYIIDGQEYITDEALKNSATNVIPHNNILIASRVGIGKVAINSIDIAISQDLTGLIINRDKISEEFLYWVLLTYKSKLKSISQGSTIKGILKNELGNLIIILPKPEEQRKIVEILNNIETRTEKFKIKKNKYGYIKKQLMNDLLTGAKRVKI